MFRNYGRDEQDQKLRSSGLNISGTSLGIKQDQKLHSPGVNIFRSYGRDKQDQKLHSSGLNMFRNHARDKQDQILHSPGMNMFRNYSGINVFRIFVPYSLDLLHVPALHQEWTGSGTTVRVYAFINYPGTKLFGNYCWDNYFRELLQELIWFRFKFHSRMRNTTRH